MTCLALGAKCGRSGNPPRSCRAQRPRRRQPPPRGRAATPAQRPRAREPSAKELAARLTEYGVFEGSSFVQDFVEIQEFGWPASSAPRVPPAEACRRPATRRRPVACPPPARLRGSARQSPDRHPRRSALLVGGKDRASRRWVMKSSAAIDVGRPRIAAPSARARGPPRRTADRSA